MDKFVDKLSSYNILNNIFPGIVFCSITSEFTNESFLKNNIIENLFLYYFVGMVLSRIGSIIIEPMFCKFKFVIFADYEKFIKAELKDNKISILSETCNVYRTMLATILMLIISKIYFVIAAKYEWITKCIIYIILIFLFILFGFSYRKQVSYVKKRVDANSQS